MDERKKREDSREKLRISRFGVQNREVLTSEEFSRQLLDGRFVFENVEIDGDGSTGIAHAYGEDYLLERCMEDKDILVIDTTLRLTHVSVKGHLWLGHATFNENVELRSVVLKEGFLSLDYATVRGELEIFDLQADCGVSIDHLKVDGMIHCDGIPLWLQLWSYFGSRVIVGSSTVREYVDLLSRINKG